MHSPLTFHSYLKPATSSYVPKMYNEVPNPDLFPIDLDVIWLIFHHVSLKRAAQMYLLIAFSNYNWKQKFEPQVLRFHINTEFPMRPAENKMSLSHKFFSSVCHFSYASMATLMLFWMATIGQINVYILTTLPRYAWSCDSVPVCIMVISQE